MTAELSDKNVSGYHMTLKLTASIYNCHFSLNCSILKILKEKYEVTTVIRNSCIAVERERCSNVNKKNKTKNHL